MGPGALITAVGLGSAVILTPSMIRIAGRFGLVDRPDSALKIHDQPVPAIGGTALGISVLLAMAITGHLKLLPTSAVLLAVVVGLIDDIRPLALWPKLVGQSGITVLIIAQAHFGVAGSSALFLASLASLNAVNLIDGQDGLGTGLGIEALLGLMLIASALHAAQSPIDWAMLGGLSAFLLWNKPLARIFLGDSGSYLIAVALMEGATSLIHRDSFQAITAVALCLGVFVFELLFTVARRTATGVELASGDRLHSYDLLAQHLGSRTQSTVAFCLIGLCCAGAGAAAAFTNDAATASLLAVALLSAAGAGRWLWRELPGQDGGDLALAEAQSGRPADRRSP